MWALEGVYGKLAIAEAGLVHTVFIRATLVCLLSLIYALVTTRGQIGVNRRQFSVIVYTAIAGTLGGDFLYFYVLTTTPVTNAVLIGHLQPVFIILIGYFILKSDRITRNDYLGIALLVFASLLVTTRTWNNLIALRLGSRGDALMLLAALLWSTSAIAMRKYLASLNAGVMILYRFGLGALVLGGILIARGEMVLPGRYALLTGLIVSIGFLLYSEGIIRIKAAQLAALELCAPFFAALLAYSILHETLTPMQACGITVLFAGVYFISKKEEL